eukprot:TRINITY_DN10588_c0_g2_i1.p1 TRINITY_DN10588_c0_g2~~TRINITY_DN10588_c0_g2_i1.p1  ORF type:complete len:237 (+),score=47.80 TRINITY_DN10588_c0_g2_i1:179-889(+)
MKLQTHPIEDHLMSYTPKGVKDQITGAHFNYKEMCQQLNNLKQTQEKAEHDDTINEIQPLSFSSERMRMARRLKATTKNCLRLLLKNEGDNAGRQAKKLPPVKVMHAFSVKSIGDSLISFDGLLTEPCSERSSKLKTAHKNRLNTKKRPLVKSQPNISIPSSVIKLLMVKSEKRRLKGKSQMKEDSTLGRLETERKNEALVKSMEECVPSSKKCCSIRLVKRKPKVPFVYKSIVHT